MQQFPWYSACSIS